MCRRTRKSIAHHSPEAELRSLRQGWWVQGGVEVCAGKVSMLFRTKTVRSHPVTQAHTVSKPFSSIIWSWIHLWLLCVQKPLSLSDPSWLPHSVTSPALGSGSCVCGSPGYHMEQSFWLEPAHGILLPYEPRHLLGVMSFVIADLLFWNDLAMSPKMTSSYHSHLPATLPCPVFIINKYLITVMQG